MEVLSSFSTPPNSTRRKRTVYSPGLSTSINLLTENDDAEEKRLRRKSKLLTNNILSPGGVQASPGRQQPIGSDKRKSVNLSHVGMSNAQLKEHYANCIKLSSENKINAKNAFGLHLIDYMKELLKQSNKEESGTNFQIASCTLDAGVKIYAYRVDSVHNEAYKVLGSLGRTKDVENEPDENLEEADIVVDGSQPQAVKKSKKKSTGKTIETNFKNINCEQLDLDFEVDPFFHKTAAAFDGSTSSLLSFQIKSKSDRNDLVMDSLADINDISTSTVGKSSEDTNMVDLSMLREMYNKLPFDTMEICPQFTGFQITGWDKDSQDIGGINLPDDSFVDNIHRFDENAPVASDAMDSFDTGSGPAGYDGDSDGDNDGIGPISYDGRPAEIISDGISSKTSILNMTGSTHLALSLQPSEYSYFNQEVLSTWAGPLHWKVKPKSKDKSISTNTTTKPVNKKAPLRINYDEEIDLKKYFASGKESTHLKETTLEKYAAQMTVLPPDLHYEADNLFKLFTRNFIMIQRQADAKEIQDDGEDWYDYDNRNDKEGFCPAVDDAANDYDDDDDYDNDNGNVGGEDTFTQTTIAEPSILAGDNLVAPPNKVRVLDINYAKAAKRIDIKKLKSTMWKMLCEDKPDEKENNENENNNLPKPVIETDDKDSGGHVSGTYSFKSMYDALPKRVSANMAKNLSGPIAFVCLLYLANEKTLKLSGKEDMSDIFIEEAM